MRSLRIERPEVPPGIVAIPVRTPLVRPGDDLIALVERAITGIARAGDVLAISETAVAIAQGQAVPAEYVRPSKIAYALSRRAGALATVNQPESLQIVIDQVGVWKVLYASMMHVVGRLIGRRGMFYEIMGEAITAIDGYTGTLPPFERAIVFAPQNPDAFAQSVYDRTAIATRDHLDFHKTFDAYASAKRRLFDMAPRCVFNAQDECGERWARELRSRKRVVTYAVDAPADLRPSTIDVRPDGSSFELAGQGYTVRIPGRFNISNALCAIAIARHLDVSDAQSAAGLASLERVAGRMDHVSAGGVDVIVDYAHTPDALENLLRTLRETARGRLIVVFGCGGDRDRGKRPQMGSIAARYADFSYVTSDNPRTEPPQAIIDEILPGVGNAPHEASIDRRAAIHAAVFNARPGDVIAIAGKGHENYQIIGTQTLPFDDLAVAQEALLRREGAHP